MASALKQALVKGAKILKNEEKWYLCRTQRRWYKSRLASRMSDGTLFAGSFNLCHETLLHSREEANLPRHLTG